MTYSRRQLYAAGEPLGECVTLPKMGGGYVCGAGSSGPFGSADNSQDTKTTNTTNNTTTTLNQDRRIVADNGAMALSADNSKIVVNALDAGAIKAASDNTALLIQAASDLNKSGLDTLKANTDWLSHVIDQTNAQATAAMQTVASVVSKPLDMQDPKNILVAVGLIVAAVVAVAALKKG